MIMVKRKFLRIRDLGGFRMRCYDAYEPLKNVGRPSIILVLIYPDVPKSPQGMGHLT